MMTLPTSLTARAREPPNAAPQPLPEAGARHERTLEAVGCRRLFGKDLARLSELPTTRRAPHRQPTLMRLAPASDGHAEKVRGRLDLRHQHFAATHDPETPRLRRLQERRVFWYRHYVRHQRWRRHPRDVERQWPLAILPQGGRIDDNIETGRITDG